MFLPMVILILCLRPLLRDIYQAHHLAYQLLHNLAGHGNVHHGQNVVGITPIGPGSGSEPKQ
jgi:hypothetical protein